MEDQSCLADVHSLPIRTVEESKSWPVGVWYVLIGFPCFARCLFIAYKNCIKSKSWPGSVLVCINVLSELISQQTGFILGYVKFPSNAQLHFLVLS